MKKSLGTTLVRYLLAWSWTLVIATLACLMCFVVGARRTWVWVRVPWARLTLALTGVRLNIAGADNLRGPAIFIANHESLIDVVFLPAVVPRTARFVAKRELLRVPFWGWAFGAGGALLIDRKNPRGAMDSLRRGAAALEPGWSLVVFPEGTRSKRGELGRFKRGAFTLAALTKLPIVPIGFAGAREVVPADGWLVRSGEVAVDVGEPIATDTWSEATLREHIAEGEAAVAGCVARARAARHDVAPPVRVASATEAVLHPPR